MSKVKNTYDALVIGGGLAGAALAIHLVRSGKSVCILEKSLTPHHKVCGEFLSVEAVTYLSELGIDLAALGAVPVTKMSLIKNSSLVQTELPFTAYSLSRYILDQALLDLAVKEGAALILGVKVQEIHENEYWQVNYGQNRVNGRALFLATGKHDCKGYYRAEGTKNDYIGFKMHYRLNMQQSYNLHELTQVIMFSGGYAGLQLIEKNCLNLCLVVEKKRFKDFDSSWAQFKAHLQKSVPYLNKVLQQAQPCWAKPLAIYGIPYGYLFKPDQQTSSSLYRLGDQMAVIPSFAGGGMAIALYTAKCAANSYLHHDALYYNRKAIKDLKLHIRKSTLLDQILATDIGQTGIMKLSQFLPVLLNKAAKYTRLGDLHGQLG